MRKVKLQPKNGSKKEMFIPAKIQDSINFYQKQIEKTTGPKSSGVIKGKEKEFEKAAKNLNRQYEKAGIKGMVKFNVLNSKNKK
jgi:hypothetical protein